VRVPSLSMRPISRLLLLAVLVGGTVGLVSALPASATPDTTPPTCTVSATRTGPPFQVDLRIQDTESGLASIVVTQSNNADTPVPPFTVGTTDPLIVTATKIDQSQPMKVTVQVTDVAGNVNTNCGFNDGPSADLSITKTDNKTSYVPGTNDTYTVTVHNAGPSDVTGATVADVLPAGTTFVSATNGATYDAGTNRVAFTTGTVGADASFDLTLAIPPTFTGSLSNTATVSPPAGVTDTNNGNNSATDTDTPQADLSITKTDNSATETPGGTTTYTIVATNNGPSGVAGATVADTFPAAVTSDTWTATYTGTGASGPASGSGNINASVNLPSGGTATFTVIATIASGTTGNLVNTATVSAPSGITDPNPGNNSAIDTDTPAPVADLSITKTDNSAAAAPGGTTTYTIVATNNGPSDVTGATVADSFPLATVTGDTWTATYSTGASGPAYGSGDINVSVNLPADGTATFTAVADIGSNAVGNLINTAMVSAPPGTTDPNPGNNSDTDTDTLVPLADLAVTKTGPGAATPGSTVTYTVTVANNGPSPAAGATLTDALPAGTTLGSVTTATPGWNCAGSTATNVVCSTAGSVAVTPPASPATFTIVANVSPTFLGQLSNMASVSSSTADPTPANNTSSPALVTAVGCTSTITATTGRLTASGTTCVLNTTVNGSIRVPAGASLVLINSTVHGGLRASRADAVTVCGSNIRGSLYVAHSTGPVLVGDAGDDSASCAGNTISGRVNLTGNTANTELGANHTGSVAFNNNTGPTAPASEAGPEVEGNTITGHLTCGGNDPSIANDGIANSVTGAETGQCAGF